MTHTTTIQIANFCADFSDVEDLHATTPIHAWSDPTEDAKENLTIEEVRERWVSDADLLYVYTADLGVMND